MSGLSSTSARRCQRGGGCTGAVESAVEELVMQSLLAYECSASLIGFAVSEQPNRLPAP